MIILPLLIKKLPDISETWEPSDIWYAAALEFLLLDIPAIVILLGVIL